MFTERQIQEAATLLSELISKADVWSDKRHSADSALSLLTHMALKSVPPDCQRTATQISENADKIQGIAYCDFLEILAQAIPYLLQRKEIAKREMPGSYEHQLKFITQINKEISKILLLF